MRAHVKALLILAMLFLLPLLTAAENADTDNVNGDELPVIFSVEPGTDTEADSAEPRNPYGDTYTLEELAAIDRALWAANMTREDMTYKKDYTEGHGCFPIVKEMMHDPLLIAPWMDAYAEHFDTLRLTSSRQPLLYKAYWLVDSEIGFKSKYTSAEFPVFETLEQLIDGVTRQLNEAAPQVWTAEELAMLRQQITASLAWHEFESGTADAGYEDAKGASDDELYQLLDRYSPQESVSHPLEMLTSMLAHGKGDSIIYPSDEPQVIDTPHGRICIGTLGDDYYEGDFAVLIEPGGNDTYYNCRIGAAYGKATPELGDGRLGYFVDLGGDDFYDCADVNITLGAAVLGVAAFYDLGGGDDRYYAGSCTLGAAMGGIATFYDDGGCDYYSGKVYTQGAAGFGIGIMIDDSVSDAPEFDTAEGNDAVIDSYATGESDVDTHSLMDNDEYTAWSNAQAFARPRGIALCINRRGNETYYAGGVYLHAPLFGDRYQSFSQGFAIGERGIDWAGGIAMLIDYDGNDKYLGDIYNQGVGYWYGAGLLWDGGGNDLYEMTQYGQGSGIHLAIGGLVDVAGNDSYIMHSGLGQGGSHDLAASILHDRGGNDRYHGSTSCNGSGLTGSVGIHIDRSGDDTYAGRKDSINVGDTRRINIGLLVDLDGTDHYMPPDMEDGALWTHTNIGMGIDIMPPPEPEGAASLPPDGGTEAAASEESEVPIPEICYYEGELTQEVFDELWEIAIRWEVGDNQFIVPEGRRRLTEFGTAVLPYMSEVMNESNSGLAYRAYVVILGALHEEYPDEVYAVLRENAASGDSERETAALYLTGELKYLDLEDVVVGFLDHEDPAKVRRAIGVLGSIGSHAADQNLIDLLDPARNDEPMIKAALTTLTDLEVDCYDELRPLLAHPLLSVRGELVKQLAAHWDVYGDEVEQSLSETVARWRSSGRPSISGLRERTYFFGRSDRSLLQVLAQVEKPPQPNTIVDVSAMFSAKDWGVRADAWLVVRHWQELAKRYSDLAEIITPLSEILEQILATETDPYVLFAAGE